MKRPLGIKEIAKHDLLGRYFDICERQYGSIVSMFSWRLSKKFKIRVMVVMNFADGVYFYHNPYRA